MPERPFDFEINDPLALARSAAIRSAREQDPLTRETARRMTPAERLRTAFELSRVAAELAARRR